MNTPTDIQPITLSGGKLKESDIIKHTLTAGRHTLILPPRFIPEELHVDPPQNSFSINIGLLSSGSTGHPRCIWNTFHNLLTNARFTAKELNIDCNDRLLILASPWHVAGLSWAMMAEFVNADYIIRAPVVGQTEQWLKLIHEFSPTHLLTVPNVLRNLSEHENWEVPEIIFGGDHLTDEYYEATQSHCSGLTHAYGQTEAGGLLSSIRFASDADIMPSQKRCVGTPAPTVYISCIGKPGAPAEIRTSSPTSIYNGYYETGDLGYLDDENRLYITGRSGKSQGNCNMLTSVTSIMHK